MLCIQWKLSKYLLNEGCSQALKYEIYTRLQTVSKKFPSFLILLVKSVGIIEPRKLIKVNFLLHRPALNCDCPQGQGRVTSSV